MSKRILVDMDGILCDFIGAFLSKYNKEFNDTLTIEDIHNHDFQRCLKPAAQSVWKSYMAEPGFFRNLVPLPNALESLKELHDAGHKIYIASSHANAISSKEKHEWLEHHVPWLNRKRFFFGYDKFMLKADVLIDDAHHNIEQYREEWPNAEIYTISYPWNQEARPYATLFAESYKDIGNAWKQIVERINK